MYISRYIYTYIYIYIYICIYIGDALHDINPENGHSFLPFYAERTSLLRGSPNTPFYSELKDVYSLYDTISSHENTEIKQLRNSKGSDRREKGDYTLYF
jgi:hypothetical protein